MRLLHQYGFELLKVVRMSRLLNLHILRDFAHQEVLDAALIAVEVAVEEEGGEVEVGAELVVHALQNVHLELLAHLPRVVVGQLDDVVRFLHVESHQQSVCGLHVLVNLHQELLGLDLRHVPQTGAQ